MKRDAYPSRPQRFLAQPNAEDSTFAASPHALAHLPANIDRGERPARTLFAVGQLLEPDTEFTVVYIESDRGSSHVSPREERREERGESVTDTHVSHREKRESSSRPRENDPKGSRERIKRKD